MPTKLHTQFRHPSPTHSHANSHYTRTHPQRMQASCSQSTHAPHTAAEVLNNLALLHSLCASLAPLPVPHLSLPSSPCDLLPLLFPPLQERAVCVEEEIVYNATPPLGGTYRLIPPQYGEYSYLPPERWVHALGVSMLTT